ncbi:MAG: HPF/RaiA family ribosome-associated protein [Arenicella sp.]
MKTLIHSNDITLSNTLHQFIQQQATRSMSICSERVERVIVRLKDINGPKGGNDKECCIEVKLANSPSVIVTKRSSTIYASVRKAMKRASRTTLRHIQKRDKNNCTLHTPELNPI